MKISWTICTLHFALLLVASMGGGVLYALPQSCAVQCDWDSLVPCSTSCHNYQANITTTCGAYNGACYDPPVCGNNRCEPKPFGSPSWVRAETHSSCAADCTDGGSPLADACVPFVVDEFDSISTSDKLFKLNNAAVSISAANNARYGIGYWDYLASHSGSPCHFQGVARLRNSPWIAVVANTVGGTNVSPFVRDFINVWADDPSCFTRDELPFNTKWGAHLWLVKMDSKAAAGTGSWGSGWSPSRDYVRKHVGLSNAWQFPHPGGMQAIGDYLVLGVDAGDGPSEVRIYRVSNPLAPVEVDSYFRSQDRAEAVAVVREEVDGEYLLAVGYDQSTRIDLYRSTSENIESPGWDYQNTIAAGNVQGKEGNWNNMGLVRECGSDRIFLIGFYNTGWHTEIFGNNFVQLFEVVTSATGSLELAFVKERKFGDAASTFAAGAGVYVNPANGSIYFYATEKYNDSAFLGGSRDDLDTDEYR